MSKKEVKNTEQKQEKAMTKYDLKVQKRKEQKEKERKAKLRDTILGVVLVVGLAALVASFPIRNYLTINGSYIKVDGETISRVEYDYNYNVAKTNYLSMYGSYLSYMGMDISSDFDGEMYSELRTWGDHFDELTVENIKQYKALAKEAKAAGFEYDTTEEYNDYMVSLEASAKEAGMTKKAFIQDMYGDFATEARVKPFVEEAMYASAYYNKVYDDKLPTQEEVMARYQTNTDDYDSVDYYVAYVDVVLPTEPTTDAETTTDNTTTEGATTDGAATGSTEAYEPTEEEIAAAMATAKAAVELKAENLHEEGELVTNVKMSGAVYAAREWLFAEERKKGDSTIIEDALNSRYYAIEFVKRYLNESLSADIRVVSTADGNADAIYEEWKNGAATEESFAQICDKYNDVTSNANKGGLYEGLRSSSLAPELQEWIFNEARVAGDTTVIKPAEGDYSYVLYYVAPNKAEYILLIENEIAGERMDEYMADIMEKVVVEDPKDNLKYPERIEAEELLAGEGDADTTTDGTTESSTDASATESSTAQ